MHPAHTLHENAPIRISTHGLLVPVDEIVRSIGATQSLPSGRKRLLASFLGQQCKNRDGSHSSLSSKKSSWMRTFKTSNIVCDLFFLPVGRHEWNRERVATTKKCRNSPNSPIPKFYPFVQILCIPHRHMKKFPPIPTAEQPSQYLQRGI